MKVPMSFRLTETAKVLLRRVAGRLGVSQTAALEVVIREAAESRDIEAPSPQGERVP